MTGGRSGSHHMRAQQKPAKQKGKRTSPTHVCDELCQYRAILDQAICVFCSASWNVVYSTKLLVGKINATRSPIRVQKERGHFSPLFASRHLAKLFQDVSTGTRPTRRMWTGVSNSSYTTRYCAISTTAESAAFEKLEAPKVFRPRNTHRRQ